MEQPATSFATPPSPERPTQKERPSSKGSIDSALSSRSHQVYLDSLVVPTKDQFDHIADVQSEREAEQKRLQREKQRQSIDGALQPASPPTSPQHNKPRHGHFFSRLGAGHHIADTEDRRRAKAATVIQRTYRGYRVRREMKGLGIDASTRWIHAVREAQWREMTKPRARAAFPHDCLPSPGLPGTRPSLARQNWKKVSTIARHAGGDLDADDTDSSSSSSSLSSISVSDLSDHKKSEEKKKRKEEAKARRKQEARMMGLQYFLEMVDLKHRYGANLLVYHEVWKSADTKENFFYWLDYGEGKNIDLDACPRERLDREQVRYLSREERQYYLVKVDDEGRLCWAKNGARIDTSSKYKDSIQGIVPSDDPTPAYSPSSENQTNFLSDTTTFSHSSRSSSSSSASSIASADAARYTSTAPATPAKKLSHHLSGTTIVNKLLRKTVRKNTWIFVADTSFRLYVGIKNSGAFQHSSFLQGSRISAAGLIRIRDGRLTSLSPLSGHYRPPASNFKAFLKSLREAGVDMSRVSVSKSYAVLVGLEIYVKARKKAGDVMDRVTGHGKKKKKKGELVVPKPAGAKQRAVGGERENRVDGVAEKQAGASTEDPEHNYGQHKEEEMRQENKLVVKVLGGTGITEPKGQKGGGDAEEGGATALSPVINQQ